MNKETRQPDIDKHYTEISSKVGTNWSSTMLDREIREKEIDNLIRLILQFKRESDSVTLKVLDVGCGNGYVAARLQCEFPFLKIDGVDTNLSMVDCANSRKLPNTKFYNASAAQLSSLEIIPGTYDLVFSTRCFINIIDEDERYQSIDLASRYVKVGGFLALIEGFESGQVSYNLLRNALGYETIPPAWHNIYLDTNKLMETLVNGFDHLNESQMEKIGLDQHFLSNRYLAMRVLLPLFKNDPDFFDSNRNDPIGLALSYLLPKTSNFSPLQLHLWKKNQE
jgi:trans-aconitate methyltransferase